MKKVLITGGNGYIGKPLTKEFLDRGFEVYLATTSVDSSIDKRVNICKASIFNGSKNIYKQLGEPDICIHMAWRDGFIHNSDKHLLELNKHCEFIQNMINGGLKHLVVIGTMHEIGYWEGKIDENTPCNPMTMYGIAKNSLRQAINIMVKDRDIVFQWLRLYYITGEDSRSNSIFSKILKMEKEGIEKFPFTTGKNKYDFIDINELVKQIVLASTQIEIQGIINCCSGNPVSLSDRVEKFIRDNNLKIKLEYGKFPERKYDSPIIYGDDSKIREILSRNK